MEPHHATDPANHPSNQSGHPGLANAPLPAVPALPPFTHRNLPAKVVFGDGTLARLGAELAELGVRRPVVVAGRRTATTRLWRAALAGMAGLAVAESVGMPEHTPLADVAALRDLARAHQADGFVAVGGGSASDACKAAALWLAEGGDLHDHGTRFLPPDQLHSPVLRAPKLPVIALPNTLSAAEVTAGGSVRTPDGRKIVLVDAALAARLIVIDPAAGMEMPVATFLGSGMNGLAHCIEGFYSRVRTPLTDGLALEAMHLFAGAQPEVARAPDSVAARGAALAAAHLSGQVLLNARSCVHHATCHVLGAVAGIPHGTANSIMLPHAMAFNAHDPGAAAALARCAPALGADTASAAGAIAAVRALQQRIGVATRLRDTGMSRTQLPEVAAKIMAEKGLYTNPRRVTGPAELETMLAAAW